MGRPSFLTTKGERNRMEGTDPDDLLHRIEDVYAGKFIIEGDGLPEDMPPDYPVRVLFRHGAFQMKDSSIGRVIVPVKAGKVDIYGRIKSAVPCGLEGYYNMSSDINTESDAPVCELPHVPYVQVLRYVRLMDRALAVLDQNVLGLSQPVIIQGTQGGEINSLLLESDLKEGGLIIPCLDKVATQAQVLNLDAQDHTQNLIGVFRAMYAEILTTIGTQGSGSEKASGMTSEETTAVTQQVNMQTFNELRAIERWCERANERFDCSISVRLGDGWTASVEDDPEEAQGEGDNGKDEIDKDR